MIKIIYILVACQFFEACRDGKECDINGFDGGFGFTVLSRRDDGPELAHFGQLGSVISLEVIVGARR